MSEQQGAAAAPAPAPVREELVTNAVSFLLNPRVRPSPTQYKREFLEKKGLTPSEITEAFRRAPEPTGAEAAAAQAAVSPAAPLAQPPAPQALAPAQPPIEPLRWTQVVLRLGLVVAAGMAAKKTLSPYAQPYVRGFFDYCGLRPADDPAAKASEEAHRRALTQTATALDARAAELARSLEDVKGIIRRSETASTGKAKEAAAAASAELSPAIRSALRELREDLASELRSVVEKVERAPPAPSPAASAIPDEVRAELSEIKALLRSSQAGPPGSNPNLRPLPSSSTPALHKLGLGDSPASPVRPYDDGLDPNPSSASSSSWRTPAGFAASVSVTKGKAEGPPPLPAPPQPDRYMAVLDILSQGGTPPGILKIDDKAPNPEQPPPEAKMQRLPKPWERAPQAQQAAAFSFEAAPKVGNGGHATGVGAASPDSPISVSGIRGAATGGGGGSSGGWRPPAPPSFSNPGAAKAFGLRSSTESGVSGPGSLGGLQSTEEAEGDGGAANAANNNGL